MNCKSPTEIKEEREKCSYKCIPICFPNKKIPYFISLFYLAFSYVFILKGLKCFQTLKNNNNNYYRFAYYSLLEIKREKNTFEVNFILFLKPCLMFNK